jgi:hypothetical protein
MTEQLGRFGHHPDPAVDFCCEVEAIEGLACDAGAGLTTLDEVKERIDRAMTFTVGGDPWAVNAKARLRNMEADMKGA